MPRLAAPASPPAASGRQSTLPVQAPHPRSNAARTLLAAVLAVVLASGAAILTLGVWLARSGLISIRGVDLNVVFTIQKLLLSGSLYTDPAAPPFDIAQYGPLFYVLVAALARFGGVAATDAEAVIVLARATSVAIAVAIAALVYVLLRRQAPVDRTTAAVAGAFAFIATSPWYFLARPDGLAALALLATVGCVAAAAGAGARGVRRDAWLLAAGTLALVALLAKQNGIVALAIVLSWAALRRDWRAVGLVVAGFAVPALIILAAGTASFGEFARQNLIDGLDNGLSFRNAVSRTYGPFLRSFAVLLPAALFIGLRWPRSAGSRLRLPLLLALGWTLAFAVVTGLKVGSAENYFNEFILVSALAGAAFLADARRAASPAAGPFAAAAGVYLLILLPIWTAGQVRDYGLWLRDAARVQRFDAAVAYLRVEAGASDRLVLGPRGFANALPTHGIVPQPELVALAFTRRTVDYSRFRAEVASGRIGYVVHGPDRPLSTYLGADFGAFEPVYEAGWYVISAHPSLVPRRAQTARTAAGADASARR